MLEIDSVNIEDVMLPCPLCVQSCSDVRERRLKHQFANYNSRSAVCVLDEYAIACYGGKHKLFLV
jgi:hypothetical protein